MTIEEIFDYVDEVKPNNYSKEIKTHWLNELEGKIQNEIMLLAQPEYISYVYRSSTELSGLSFPNDHTLLLPRRIKAHVGGELELNGLTLYAANNLKGLEILSISSDGKHLSFAEGSFTATGSAGDRGTLMFDGSATTPLIKFPFGRIYTSWLIMKVSEHLEESSQFANSAAQFRDDWNGFAAWYADTYRPADGVPTFKGYYLVGKQGDPGLPGKDGSDGITPMIGENGNWYFDEADTGKPSRGVPGAKGDKGDPGTAATIEIGSVTTVDAGTDAEVSNSGTQGAALFNFKIPKGEKGDPGEPALMLHGTVSANNEIVFAPLPDGQAPYSAATAAYAAGRLVQIDATDASGNWNTILTLSRVGLDELQFFNYEETESYGEQRLQLVKMLDDSSATYDYIEVPSKTSQLTNDSGFLTNHQDISGKQDKSTLEADVAAKGFTKNTGTYSKPTGGIPKADLAAAVQTSLGKADTALQSHQSLTAYRTAAAQDEIDSGKQDKSTLEADVAAKGFTKNTGTYSKPTGGIPKADLAAAVQTSLGKADTALQSHQSLTAYRTAAAQDEIDSGKVDKVTGKGLSTNDYTAAAKAKVDAIPANPKYTDTVYDDSALKERVATIEGKESAWDAKSDFSGSYNDLTDKPTIPAEVTPLIGTIDDLTPSQVQDAVLAGRPVAVQYTDSTYGVLKFTNFNTAASHNLLASVSIIKLNGSWVVYALYGNMSTQQWETEVTQMAEAQEPLIGTADSITPSQVVQAVLAGRPVVVTAVFTAFAAFTVTDDAVISSCINDNRYVVRLCGNLNTDTWMTDSTQYLTLETLPKYGGESE